MTISISHFSILRVKNPGIFSIISPRYSVKKILQKVWFSNLASGIACNCVVGFCYDKISFV